MSALHKKRSVSERRPSVPTGERKESDAIHCWKIESCLEPIVVRKKGEMKKEDELVRSSTGTPGGDALTLRGNNMANTMKIKGEAQKERKSGWPDLRRGKMSTIPLPGRGLGILSIGWGYYNKGGRTLNFRKGGKGKFLS